MVSTSLCDHLRDWADRVERDEVPHPIYFSHRAVRLVRRGLLPAIADEVRAAGSTRIVRSLEAATTAELRALNSAWKAQA